MLNSRIDGGYMNLTLIVNMMELILDFFCLSKNLAWLEIGCPS